MRRRKRLSKKSSQRRWKKGKRVKSRNLTSGMLKRGGIRL